MKLDKTSGIHEEAVKLRARRSEVLASNLANADTPWLQGAAIDFKAMPRKEVQQPVRLASTHSAHIRTDKGLVASTQMGYRIPHQPSVDGNRRSASRASSAPTPCCYQGPSLRFLDSRVKGSQVGKSRVTADE